MIGYLIPSKAVALVEAQDGVDSGAVYSFFVSPEILNPNANPATEFTNDNAKIIRVNTLLRFQQDLYVLNTKFCASISG
jgi:hypothetical protein